MKKFTAGFLVSALCAALCVFFWHAAVSWKSAADNRAKNLPVSDIYSQVYPQTDDIAGMSDFREADDENPLKTGADSCHYPGQNDKRFCVYQDGLPLKNFPDLNAAIGFAHWRVNCEVYESGLSVCVWDNCPPFAVYSADDPDRNYAGFGSFPEAIRYAQRIGPSFIYFRKNASCVWQNAAPLTGRASIAAPEIPQNPELPRGCEVTSLAMLLHYFGINADKMELAGKISKNDAAYEVVDGAVHYGDPNDGFVGDIYSTSGMGLGVYHGPVFRLLAEYAPRTAMDLTGCEFADLLFLLENGAPVWVIVNAAYEALPASDFLTWQTAGGPIKVTYSEHSVLVTGYDDKYVYFNDPLGIAGKARRAGFIAAWEQMGRQAVACAP